MRAVVSEVALLTIVHTAYKNIAELKGKVQHKFTNPTFYLNF